jgi:hypothetical protein
MDAFDTTHRRFLLRFQPPAMRNVYQAGGLVFPIALLPK